MFDLELENKTLMQNDDEFKIEEEMPEGEELEDDDSDDDEEDYEDEEEEEEIV
jgi:hypothetical protein